MSTNAEMLAGLATLAAGGDAHSARLLAKAWQWVRLGSDFYDGEAVGPTAEAIGQGLFNAFCACPEDDNVAITQGVVGVMYMLALYMDDPQSFLWILFGLNIAGWMGKGAPELERFFCMSLRFSQQKQWQDMVGALIDWENASDANEARADKIRAAGRKYERSRP